ncbi:F-box protein At5g46170 isoform X1 [Lactuca sativa]|uniref:F-box domain-containing protein n=1 Tax=Lactuca sativa TaxID=4236 RepID=A0A9R1W931_LACSA|nr:F-box protein At5g46170 isoform X1 [Lactuca sativa]XP_023741062.1 F-box protein At5g46170 isoform X1 [Lactuca sativa]XP_023741063.1 F-box protein At5g46170 isoform X1 [Lactuca sativa]KAJ0218577.1 hypothetical protein LSAT_V11C300147110 [Lactuca sativa]
MRNLKKSRDGDADDSSSINRLPDEIILQIINKIIDFKSLCVCYLVSRRFSSIVLQVDAISFTAPCIYLNIPDKNAVSDISPSGSFPPLISSFYGESFLSANRFFRNFKGVKSLCIELPSSSHRAIGNRFVFKWKVKFSNRVESFIFLSQDSVCDKDGFYLNGNGEEEEEDNELFSDSFKQKRQVSFECLMDVLAWHLMLLYLVNDLPMLEEVSITDSGRRGRLSLSGKKLNEVKEWVHSASETELDRVEIPDMVSKCYIPVLKLPVSGYVMRGVFITIMEVKDLQGENNGLMNNEDGFEDKEEAAYTEAVMEILKNHKGNLSRLR